MSLLISYNVSCVTMSVACHTLPSKRNAAFWIVGPSDPNRPHGGKNATGGLKKLLGILWPPAVIDPTFSCQGVA